MSSIECQVGGCFAAGTPLLTPDGWKAIEAFVPGDEILTRDEDDATGPVHAQVVEQVFRRHTRVLRVVVRGQEVLLTEEHPFYTFRKGWTPAHQLVPGDLVLGLEKKWAEVESVADTGRDEVVYNMAVRDAHTFFVGKEEWGFALWVHNTDSCAKTTLDQLPGKIGKTGPIKEVQNEQALTDLFNTLSKDGATVNSGTYPGVVKQLSDGTIVRMRPGSKSGGATLDITMPDGKIYKEHIK